MKRSYYRISGLLIGAIVAGLLIWNGSANIASAQKILKPAIVVGGAFNARDEFALTQGGANGVWNYGYSASDTDNTLTLFAPATDTDTIAGCNGGNFERWRINNPDTIPQIARHNPALTCSGIPSNALFIHPGFNGQRAVVRWTAPTSGTFQLTGSLQRVSLGATVDLKIIKNAATPGQTVVFAGNNSSSFQIAYNVSVTVAAGDKVDFSVGNGNGSQIGDASSLSIDIAPAVNSCLTAPANLQVNIPAENSPMDVASVNPNASLVGDATYTNMGKVGRAFDLDGAGDYVRVEDNLAQRPATAVTTEGWFKFDSVGGVVSLISKPLRDSALNSYTLYLDGGQLRGLVSNGPQYTRVFSNFTPQTGVWHHLAFTYDLTGGVSTLKLFANGVEVTSGQDGTANIPMAYDANPFPLLIGGEFENNAPGFFLDGQADEVAVYGRALASNEIVGIVQRGSFGKCGPAPCIQSPGGLVSWYAGEGNALDSKSGNHGTLFNGATFQTAKVGSGIKLDGVDDRVEIADAPSLKPQFLTVETWARFDTLSSNTAGGAPSGYQILVFKKNPSVGNYEGYSLQKNPDNKFAFSVGQGNGAAGNSAVSTTTATTGVFYHLAATYDGAAMKLYVNGQLESTVPYNLPLSYDTRPVFLGTTGESFFDGRFNGVLDETSIYSRALTASEVLSIYNAGASGKCKPVAPAPASNQIAWFTGDGDSRDFTTLNPNGILRGDANYGVGKVGQAFNLDGNGDYVEVPDNPNQRPATQLTAEGWFKFAGFSTSPHMIAKGLRGSDRDSYVMWFGNNNIRIGYSDSASNMFVYDTGFVPKPGEFSHYAMVLNTDDAGPNANTFKLYVNGAEVFSGTAGGPVFYDANPHPLTIGADINNDVPDFPLGGQIDEVSLYSRALSASEVAAIYSAGNAGKAKTATVVAPLVARSRAKTAQIAPLTIPISSATVSFANLTGSGQITESNIDLGGLPALPAGATATGLAFDIATTASYQNGAADDVRVCFNVPALASLSFTNLRILHLENGAWVNRTASGNVNPNVCTDDLPSLSPFAIVQVAPTAAAVSVAGRVVDAVGNGISRVSVTLTDSQGRSVAASTNSFGRYRFDGVLAGEVYTVSVASKRYRFAVSSQAVMAGDAVENVDFTAFEGLTGVSAPELGKE